MVLVSVGVVNVVPVAPVFQVTLPVQPEAVRVADCPAQMVAEVTTRLAAGWVVIVIAAVALQPAGVVQVAE